MLRSCCALLAGGLILTGCSGSEPGGNDNARPKSSPAPSASARPSASPTANPTPTRLDFTPDPARAPRTEADARRLALAVVAGPDSWGPDYVARRPHHSAPGYWPVLSAQCTWETGTRPATVLHSVTAYSEIPAAAGKGPLQVSATVTVHRTETDADWEMAQTLEEALRCPDQRLREGERISGLISLGNPFGVGGNFTAADSLGEGGKYHNDAFGGPQKYAWYQSRVSQVTVAVVAKGAPGHVDKDIDHAQVQALVTMVDRAESQLEAQS
ncbi:hypothetical protein [Streptomyces purpureus]|uniref:Lipoprotein n=1 Tax=Streptomyces purpureus TaxID=1951 RepID=A0A918H1Z7_9ACTN|nr:hypothetical protein [Streptomyces purpureus]GGT31652.1 hypothetical protein GCM10014713_26510 [Streptomyces purpureus]